MKIKKVFNNNVVLTEDSNHTELVVMGRGLAFQKKVGEEVDHEKIEKTFKAPSENFANKLSELIDEIPYDVIILTKDIIELASKELKTELYDSLFLTLSDHIHFAITRLQNHLVLKNALTWEVQKFYKEEYAVGRKALQVIQEKTGMELPEDEATSIALHLFNARQEDSRLEETMAMTNIVKDITNIVKYHYGIEFDEDSMNYSRFVTHLRYFAYRLLREELNNEQNETLFDQVKKQYPEAHKCTKKVEAYLHSHYAKTVTKEELTYFMIHIQRVSNRAKS